MPINNIKENNIPFKILFIAILFIFCIGINCINSHPDNDLWARLTAGGYIIENLSLAKTDFLSYTPTHTWYDHEWGSSIIFYIILKYFGASGLILLKGILTALTLFMCYKTVELRKSQYSISYNILFYAFMLISFQKSLGSTVRCLMFSCLFFTLFLYILERSRLSDKKPLIILPFIMVLWANMHGGCASGLGLIFLYIIGSAIDKKNFLPYLYTFIGCLAALFVNPYGIDYVYFLFNAVTMDRSFITEWASPFHRYYFNGYINYKIFTALMILIQIISVIKAKKNCKSINKTEIIILLTTLYLSVCHIRNIPFFVITAGIFLYDDFYFVINEIFKFTREILRINNDKIINNIVLLKEITVYLLIFIMYFTPIISKKEIRITETEYPRYSVEFVKINNLKGNLLINFDWGSYAAYKLYPNNLIFMDGRYEEVYNPDLLTKLKNFHLVKTDNWDEIIKDYKTDVMILEKKYPVYKKIKEGGNWEVVFENNYSGVFVPKESVKEKYYYPIADNNYYNLTLFNTQMNYNAIKRNLE